jgi:hypothetical protein
MKALHAGCERKAKRPKKRSRKLDERVKPSYRSPDPGDRDLNTETEAIEPPTLGGVSDPLRIGLSSSAPKPPWRDRCDRMIFLLESRRATRSRSNMRSVPSRLTERA